MLTSLYCVFHLTVFFLSLILFSDLGIVQWRRKSSTFGGIWNLQTQGWHGKKKKIELGKSGVMSQMSQIKPLLTQLLIVQYFKINKECKQEIIIVLTKLDHLEIVF